jgi:hypothetical protein
VNGKVRCRNLILWPGCQEGDLLAYNVTGVECEGSGDGVPLWITVDSHYIARHDTTETSVHSHLPSVNRYDSWQYCLNSKTILSAIMCVDWQQMWMHAVFLSCRVVMSFRVVMSCRVVPYKVDRPLLLIWRFTDEKKWKYSFIQCIPISEWALLFGTFPGFVKLEQHVEWNKDGATVGWYW